MKKPTPLPLRSCFDDLEGYNALGSEIQDKFRAYLADLLKEYPDVICRDMRVVIEDVLDGTLVFHRTLRLYEAMAAEEAKEKIIAE